MNQIYLARAPMVSRLRRKPILARRCRPLSPAECAMLAGLPQNPHYVNPIRQPQACPRTPAVALSLMHSHGAITDAQYEAAKSEKLVVRKGVASEVHAEYVAEMVRQQVVAQYGDKAYTWGIDVTTTLVAAEQQAAHQACARRSLKDPCASPGAAPKTTRTWQLT